jgi:hypothetical protein
VAPEGSSYDALADLLFPPQSGYSRPESLDTYKKGRDLVELLIKMADIYERSFAWNKQGQVIKDKSGKPMRVEVKARTPGGDAACPSLSPTASPASR